MFLLRPLPAIFAYISLLITVKLTQQVINEIFARIRYRGEKITAATGEMFLKTGFGLGIGCLSALFTSSV
jgi:hypothetical protein